MTLDTLVHQPNLNTGIFKYFIYGSLYMNNSILFIYFMFSLSLTYFNIVLTSNILVFRILMFAKLQHTITVLTVLNIV